MARISAGGKQGDWLGIYCEAPFLCVKYIYYLGLIKVKATWLL